MYKSVNDMSTTELKSLIQLKEKKYREAIKARKVFWEVKRILEQKRAIEKEVAMKKTERCN